MSDTAKPVRYHSLDALRAFALLLGIVFHAAESFCPGRKSWAIIDSHAQDAFGELQPWSHGDYRIVLKDGTHLRLSRRYQHGFLERFH